MLVSRSAAIDFETASASKSTGQPPFVEQNAVEVERHLRGIEAARRRSRPPRRCGPSWGRPRRWPSSPAGCRRRSWRFAGRLAAIWQPWTSTVIRCVAPSPSAGIDWARSSQTSSSVARNSASVLPAEHRAAGRAVGQQQHRVVGAHVAVDADAIERFVDRVGKRGLGVLLA